jgi:hypothetical protein
MPASFRQYFRSTGFQVVIATGFDSSLGVPPVQ